MPYHWRQWRRKGRWGVSGVSNGDGNNALRELDAPQVKNAPYLMIRTQDLYCLNPKP